MPPSPKLSIPDHLCTETEIQSQILQWLRNCKILHWRVPVGGVRKAGGKRARSSMTGFPDICGLTPSGRMFVIEVKAAKGRLSSEQSDWLERLYNEGAHALVVRGLSELQRAFVDAITKDDPIRYGW
jgi:hypothetical protein